MSVEGRTYREWLEDARTLRHHGHNKKAIDAFRKALQANPEGLDAINEMGLVHIKIGEQVLATIAFDMAISILVTDPRAHANKAEACLTTGSYEDALAVAEEGIKHNPTDSSLWVKKARSLESQLKIDDAIAA